jgi:internalin A
VLPTLPELRTVALAMCPHATDIESILACDQLESIAGEDFTIRDVRALLGRFGALANLRVRRCRGVVDVAELGAHAQLRQLELDACPKLRTLSGLENFSSLRALSLVDCPELAVSDEHLATAKLFRLDIRWCSGIRNLEALRRVPTLQTLRLQGLQVTDLAPLADLAGLRSLELMDCEQITDLRPLAGLPALRQLSLQRTGTRLDLGALRGKENLQVVHSGNAYNTKELGASSTVTIGATPRVPD